MESPNKEGPFELEKWLTYLRHMEQYSDNIARISIAENLGHPQFSAAETLTHKQLEQKLDEVLELMAGKGLNLDVLDENVSEAEVYRFITEELFLEKSGRY